MDSKNGREGSRMGIGRPPTNFGLKSSVNFRE